MITSQITLWIAACVALALAVRVIFCEKASISTLAFVTGLVLLALDSIFGALSATASDLGATLRWYQWRFIVLAFTPSAWLAFSVTYARGNYTAFWRRWLPAILLLAIALPAAAKLRRAPTTISASRLRTML